MEQGNGQAYAPVPTTDVEEIPHPAHAGTDLFEQPEAHHQTGAPVFGIPVPDGPPPQYPGSGAPAGPVMGVVHPGSYPTGAAHPQQFMPYPGQVQQYPMQMQMQGMMPMQPTGGLMFVQNVGPQPVSGAVATPQLPPGFFIGPNQTTFIQRWANNSLFIICLISVAISITCFVIDLSIRAQESIRAHQSTYNYNNNNYNYNYQNGNYYRGSSHSTSTTYHSPRLMFWVIVSLACAAFSLFVGEDFEARFDDMARFITVIKRPLTMRLCCCFPCERGYGVPYSHIAAVEFVFGVANQSRGGIRWRRQYSKRAWVAIATLIGGQKVPIGVFAGVPTDASWFPAYQAFLSQRLPQAQVVHPASSVPLVAVGQTPVVVLV